mmetsp:Transcript_9538/g.27139  ORF Transcript_9538/g.27139 Transcript_9538/m.27139 type:complete len:309 (+) Transcript_9538:164-1090(+)
MRRWRSRSLRSRQTQWGRARRSCCRRPWRSSSRSRKHTGFRPTSRRLPCAASPSSRYVSPSRNDRPITRYVERGPRETRWCLSFLFSRRRSFCFVCSPPGLLRSEAVEAPERARHPHLEETCPAEAGRGCHREGGDRLHRLHPGRGHEDRAHQDLDERDGGQDLPRAREGETDQEVGCDIGSQGEDRRGCRGPSGGRRGDLRRDGEDREDRVHPGAGPPLLEEEGLHQGVHSCEEGHPEGLLGEEAGFRREAGRGEEGDGHGRHDRGPSGRGNSIAGGAQAGVLRAPHRVLHAHQRCLGDMPVLPEYL